mgnify:FL=1
MTRYLFAFISGSLFALGLVISGMTNTLKIQGWLDFFGNWDPTLAFVLGGAIIPMFISWKIVQNKNTCLLGSKIPQNEKSPINIHLIIGSLLFGAGWGLVGLCPGPAIASITFGGKEGYIFIIAMLIGMSLKNFLIKEKNTFIPKYN